MSRSGWFGDRHRHSLAAKYGFAGRKYMMPKLVMFKQVKPGTDEETAKKIPWSKTYGGTVTEDSYKVVTPNGIMYAHILDIPDSVLTELNKRKDKPGDKFGFFSNEQLLGELSRIDESIKAREAVESDSEEIVDTTAKAEASEKNRAELERFKRELDILKQKFVEKDIDDKVKVLFKEDVVPPITPGPITGVPPGFGKKKKVIGKGFVMNELGDNGA